MAHTASQLGFPAKYKGICGECDTEFPVGTVIRFRGLSELVHAHGCPDPLEPIGSAQEKRCTDCWLIHAGDCF